MCPADRIFQIGPQTTGPALFQHPTLFDPNASIWALKTLGFLQSFGICYQNWEIPSIKKSKAKLFKARNISISKV